ncbi:hypothetical protein E4U44_000932 [Claviceps purpurea]|nr:hypothetical protein E4U44_000932 [Claviceps purpurea]
MLHGHWGYGTHCSGSSSWRVLLGHFESFDISIYTDLSTPLQIWVSMRSSETSPLGENHKILGARIERDWKPKTLTIDQKQHITNVLDHFGFDIGKHRSKRVPAADNELFDQQPSKTKG